MNRTTLAFITASILSLAACGGDDSSSGPGTGGTGGSGGTTSTGGTSGKAGSGGAGGGGAGTGGSSGGGQAGSTPGDASSPMDARRDTPTGTNDANIDRGTTLDGGRDTGTADAMPPSDVPSLDTGSPPDGGGQPDAPPGDGSSGDVVSDAQTDAPVGDGGATMVLTSTGFVEGAMIPSDFTCAGTNVSPPLQWTPGPAGTMSYALVFTDKNNGLIHSIIYDIPSSVTSLPMAVERTANPSTPAGAKQLLAYDSMPGYAGPCPNGQLHTYEFSLRAIDVAALPGVTTSTMRPMAEPIITMHTLARGILTGQSNAKK